MRALVLQNNKLVYCDDRGHDFRPEMIPIQVRLAGICETDLQLVQGYMQFNGILGHEFVGVAQSGRFEGKRVVGEINCACHQCDSCRSDLPNHCPDRTVIGILNQDGAFADTVWVPEENLHEVPNQVPDEVAVFTEPLAAAFQIQEQVELGRFANTLVVGDGRLGYLIAQVLRHSGCKVTVLGKHPSKLERFDSLGFTTRLHGIGNPERTFDLAVDCTGSPSGIPTAVSFLKPRGTLVLKSTIADPAGPNLASIVIDEITLVGSRCGPFDKALIALSKGEIEVNSLIDAVFPLEEGVKAFAKARQPGIQKVLIRVR